MFYSPMLHLEGLGKHVGYLPQDNENIHISFYLRHIFSAPRFTKSSFAENLGLCSSNAFTSRYCRSIGRIWRKTCELGVKYRSVPQRIHFPFFCSMDSKERHAHVWRCLDDTQGLCWFVCGTKSHWWRGLSTSRVKFRWIRLSWKLSWAELNSAHLSDLYLLHVTSNFCFLEQILLIVWTNQIWFPKENFYWPRGWSEANVN